MTKEEAAIRTSKGIWNNISEYIRERIEDKCDEGEYETRVYINNLSDDDKNRLCKLNYTITLDNSDDFYPEYVISWE